MYIKHVNTPCFLCVDFLCVDFLCVDFSFVGFQLIKFAAVYDCAHLITVDATLVL